MREPNGQQRSPVDLFCKAVELIDQGRCLAMAVVLGSEGSAPQRIGVRALLEQTGRIWGTIGGGMVEAEVQRRAVEAYARNRPVVFDIHLDSTYSRDALGICGGRMRILIDPTVSKDRECYARAAEAIRRRECGVLLTRVCTGGQTEVTAQWFSEEDIPEQVGLLRGTAIRSCLARGTAQLLAVDSPSPDTHAEVLVESVAPGPVLLIAGGGHVGQALAHQAVPNGFDVTVLDDRPEFTDPALFPDGVSTCCGDIAREVARFPVTNNVYIVLVTRGHKQDAQALEACIHTSAAYIGMIGSKRKVAMIRKNFIESGFATESEFGRVFAPIGFDIGAVTVPEIATSIVAQLIAVRRKGSARTTPADMPI